MEQALALAGGSVIEYKELMKGDVELFMLKFTAYLKENQRGSERTNNIRGGNVKP
jgi:hypothetical protein